jgi:hypothetical protein
MSIPLGTSLKAHLKDKGVAWSSLLPVVHGNPQGDDLVALENKP